eukprot:788347-Amphidinium_carterae.1
MAQLVSFSPILCQGRVARTHLPSQEKGCSIPELPRQRIASNAYSPRQSRLKRVRLCEVRIFLIVRASWFCIKYRILESDRQRASKAYAPIWIQRHLYLNPPLLPESLLTPKRA